MIDETGQYILDLIDGNRDKIIAFAEDIAAHPEPGYEEIRTSQKTAELLKNLGYEVTEHLARTGVKGQKCIKEGPVLTVIGELDAIGCHTHPKADPHTGVAHACGHHAQMAAMIGCAIAMADSRVQEQLDGSVNFLADPEKAYILSAKLLALTVYNLLRNGGREAEKIKNSHIPVFDKDKYIQYVRHTTEVK